MAQESCNLDKEEAAPSSNPAPPPSATAAAPALFLKAPSSQDQLLQQQLGPRDAPMPGSPTNSSSISSISCFSRKRKLEASLLHPPPEADAVAADCEVIKAQKSDNAPDAPTAAATKSTVNRCTCCQKRVGLTGFRCRCGDLFCAQHRHSNAHGCSFDYKAAGRAEITKANPVVRAPKIIKI